MSFRDETTHPDELLSASLTGELSSDEARLLREHLDTCEICRGTLAGFREQRSLVRGLRTVDVPRDLGARVNAGIEAGRFGRARWWRRTSFILGLGGSLAAVAAGVAAVVVLGNLRPSPPIAAAASSSPVASVASAVPSAVTTPEASPATALPTPAIEVGPGEYAALVARGGTPDQPNRQWEFRDLSSSRSVQVESAAGVPVSAELSPTGDQLAYITSLGESGAQEVRVLDLTDGTTSHLGCSQSWPFTDRLTWSPDGQFLAYTLAGVDLGGSQRDCAAADEPIGQSDAWIFSVADGTTSRFTTSGDAYAAAFRPSTAADGPATLIVSHAAAVPWSEELAVPGTQPPSAGTTVENVFMPRLSPDGSAALFWRGTMDGGADGWWFVQAGMPYLSGVPDASAAPWLIAPDGSPLFTDLAQPRGDGFEHGNLTWSPDGSWVAFWNGQWTGVEQGPAGDYPASAAAYVGRTADGLDAASRVDVGDASTYVEDVKFDAGGQAVLVMVAATTAGIGEAPSATIYSVPLDGSGAPTPIAGPGGSPVPWIGPIVVASGSPSPSPSPTPSP